VSWSPSELAGTDRDAAVAAPDESSALWLNVGSRGYAQNAMASSDDPAEAPITSAESSKVPLGGHRTA
jgi:hypothetical protein